MKTPTATMLSVRLCLEECGPLSQPSWYSRAQHALFAFLLNLCKEITSAPSSRAIAKASGSSGALSVPTSSARARPSIPTIFGSDSIALSMVQDRLAEGQARIRHMHSEPKHVQELLSTHIAHSMRISDRNILESPQGLEAVKSIMVNDIMADAYIEQSLWQGLYLYMRLIDNAYNTYVLNARVAPREGKKEIAPVALRMLNCLNALRIRFAHHLSVNTLPTFDSGTLFFIAETKTTLLWTMRRTGCPTCSHALLT